MSNQKANFFDALVVRAAHAIPFTKLSALVLIAAMSGCLGQVAAQNSNPFTMPTYHNDNFRTGWNLNEKILTPSAVQSGFALLKSVALDEQVDAQPLIMWNTDITGFHPVVYVVTENNTLYAINGNSGAILQTRNFGPPVPLPLGCGNNSKNVGVSSTPVIDPAAGTMYVMVYTLSGSTPIYQVHAVDLSTLQDKVPAVTVTASHALSDGKTIFTFNAAYQRQRAALLLANGQLYAAYQRQRAALLLANGQLYAAFASFCDFRVDVSRGWVLGWSADTLAALPANYLNDTQVSDAGSFFLSSIWMSGYGPATDWLGNLYFVTGNSDANAPTYDGVHNIQESVVKLSPDLKTVLSVFTPSNFFPLDQSDLDFGSGGALVLPPLFTLPQQLAAAAGKDGRLFLMNQLSLGGYTPGGPNSVLDTQSIGPCWCGPSALYPGDGTSRIVSSGGSTVMLWKVQTSPAPKLVLVGSAPITSGQDGGTFTTVSSNWLDLSSTIIWAIGRPTGDGGPPTQVTLEAFSATPSGSSLPKLVSLAAGTWPNLSANANIVPTVANGQVYVASYKVLNIFGLENAGAGLAAVEVAPAPTVQPGVVTGILVARNGTSLTLQIPSDAAVQVDASEAIAQGLVGVLVVGQPFSVIGAYDGSGVLHATTIYRAGSTHH
jgi:hypothetical protein